jgi:RHS repeat-associated protein
VKAAYGYLPYGDKNDAITKTGSGFTANTNLYRYTGKRFDPAAKSYDMGARTYMPGVGRWFQQDRYANGLDNLALSTDPLAQNRYAFTAANPINYIEIDGHILGIPCKPKKLCNAAKTAAKKTATTVGKTVSKTPVVAGATIVAKNAPAAAKTVATVTKNVSITVGTATADATAAAWTWYNETYVPWERQQLRAAYNNEYVGSCLLNGATAAALGGGPYAAAGGCLVGLAIQAGKSKSGNYGAVATHADYFLTFLDIKRAAAKGLLNREIPKWYQTIYREVIK